MIIYYIFVFAYVSVFVYGCVYITLYVHAYVVCGFYLACICCVSILRDKSLQKARKFAGHSFL